MARLTKRQILEADDIKIEVVPVPEWGGEVAVRTLTGDERDKFELAYAERSGRVGGRNGAGKHGRAEGKAFVAIRARLVQLTVVGEDDKTPMFTDAEIVALGKKSAAALDRVFEVASKLNRIGQRDIEDLEGNSDAGRSDDSGSSSPSASESQTSSGSSAG